MKGDRRDIGQPGRAFAAFSRCREGAAILEFALVLPILLLLVGACFEIGRALLIYQSMTEAVHSGARTLARLPASTCCGGAAAGAIERVRAAISGRSGLAADRIRIAPTADPTSGTVGLRVEVSLAPAVFSGFWPENALTLRASHQEMRVAE